VEVVDYYGGRKFVGRILLEFGAVAGADEDAFFDSSVPAAFQVDQFVADDEAFGKVDTKLVTGVEQELGGRFSSTAWSIGGLGSDVDFFEPDVFVGQFV